MAGVVHVPWYATGFRGDGLEAELERLCRISMHYGAGGYELFRSQEDRYRLLQVLRFERKLDWERYWEGPEVTDFRVACQGWFQVPVLYAWHDVVASAQGALSNGHA